MWLIIGLLGGVVIVIGLLGGVVSHWALGGVISYQLSGGVVSVAVVSSALLHRLA